MVDVVFNLNQPSKFKSISSLKIEYKQNKNTQKKERKFIMKEEKSQRELLWEKVSKGSLTIASILSAVGLTKNTVQTGSPFNFSANKSNIDYNALFQSACNYAFLKLGVTIEQIQKIVRVINAHPEARNFIIKIIGSNEEAVFLDSLEDSKRKLKSSDTINMNVRGGQTIFLMSAMTEEQIFAFLQASGGFSSTSQNIKNVAKKVVDATQSLAESPSLKTFVKKIEKKRTSINDWLASH